MKLILNKDTTINTTILKKIIDKWKAELPRLIKLENYYLGKSEITHKVVADTSKPCNKIVHPFPHYITESMVGYFMGKRLTYLDEDKEALDELMMVLSYNDSHAEDLAIARDCSIYGVAFELLYTDEYGNVKFTKISPQQLIPIYDDSIENKLLYAIRLIPIDDIETGKHSYRIDIYDSLTIRHYSANESLSNFSFDYDEPHYFGDVPFIEYQNNEMYLGDYEEVISIIDAYDTLQSDSLDDYAYFVDAYLMLSGVSADADDIKLMKENRVLLLDEDSKAEWLIKNQSSNLTEELKIRLVNDIHKFAQVPDLTDKEFAGNASGVAIKYKMIGTEELAATKESYFRKGILKRVKLIFSIINLKGASYDWRAVDVAFNRSLPANESEIADMVQKFSGIVSTETLLAQVPFIEDVEAEMDRLGEDLDKNPFYNLNVNTDGDSNEREN